MRANGRDLHRRLDAALALEPRAAEGCKLKATMAAARQHLFVFVARRDVPATNTVSERALRPSVIFRKVTNGFRSGWGAKAYADTCSVIATGLLNGHTARNAIRNAIAAKCPLAPA